MADETSPVSSATGLEGKIAALNLKIERESRFTRSLMVICTAAVLGVSLVPVKIMLSDMPTIMWAEFSNHLDMLHDHWKLLDRTYDARHTTVNEKAATTPAPDPAK